MAEKIVKQISIKDIDYIIKKLEEARSLEEEDSSRILYYIDETIYILLGILERYNIEISNLSIFPEDERVRYIALIPTIYEIKIVKEISTIL